MLWIAAALVVGLALGVVAGRTLARRAAAPTPAPDTATIDSLRASNALLRTLATSPDIPRSLSEVASRIRAIVPCDRIGLALLTEDREGYSTYTARLDQRTSPDAGGELHFPRRSSLIDEVVEARQARVVEDVAALAPTYLDVNVVKTSGFASFVLIPLIFEGEPFGTLNLVARRPGAFSEADVRTLRPVADALAAAYGTRRLANALARQKMATELSDLTFAFANDMSGAVQAIIGQCELLALHGRDAATQRDVTAMLQQARRLRDILTQMQRMTREHVANTTNRPH
jgi:GAF domain-containing protein